MSGHKVLIALQNELYAQDMLQNLLLSIQARRTGYSTMIEDSSRDKKNEYLKMIESDKKFVDLMGLEAEEDLYCAVLIPRHLQNYETTNVPKTLLWHERLGQVSFGRLKDT